VSGRGHCRQFTPQLDQVTVTVVPVIEALEIFDNVGNVAHHTAPRRPFGVILRRYIEYLAREVDVGKVPRSWTQNGAGAGRSGAKISEYWSFKLAGRRCYAACLSLRTGGPRQAGAKSAGVKVLCDARSVAGFSTDCFGTSP